MNAIFKNNALIKQYEKELISAFQKREFFDYSNINMLLEQKVLDVFEIDDLDEQEEFVESFLKTRKRFLVDNFIKPMLIDVCVKDEQNLEHLNNFVLLTLEF